MFKPEISKSQHSIWKTRKTYSETRSEQTYRSKKNLDQDLKRALHFIKDAKSEIKKASVFTSHTSSFVKRNGDIPHSSSEKKVLIGINMV